LPAVVSLVVEASLKLQGHLPALPLLLFCAFATQFFYNGAYLLQSNEENLLHPRAKWYQQNKTYLRGYQLFLFILLIVTGAYSLLRLQHLPSRSECTLLVVLLFFSIAYYGIKIKEKHYSLRGLGWTKPFIIALAWTGMVVWFPNIYFGLTQLEVETDRTALLLVSANNFIVITLLAIVFDVKDYADDKNEDIKTFVVRFGINGTITRILLPLTLLGMGITCTIGYYFHYPLPAMVCQLLTYLLLYLLLYSLQKKRSIYFYLLLVDGVLILKGMSGIAAFFLS
jgi:4-hydroxybenzoate polyprenyltransferase